MKRTPIFHAAASALLLSCAPDDLAQDDATTTGTTPVTASGSDESGPEPEFPPPANPWPGGSPCQVDADCDAGHLCELRICVAGCEDADACDPGQVCDLHGRCQSEAGDATALHFAGTPTLTERQTVLALGETRARTVLRNDGTEALTYRLAASHPALTLNTAPAKTSPHSSACSGRRCRRITPRFCAATTGDRRLRIRYRASSRSPIPGGRSILPVAGGRRARRCCGEGRRSVLCLMVPKQPSPCRAHLRGLPRITGRTLRRRAPAASSVDQF